MSSRHELYSAEEVAAHWRVSPRTVRHWAAIGALPEHVYTRTPSGILRFSREALPPPLDGPRDGR